MQCGESTLTKLDVWYILGITWPWVYYGSCSPAREPDPQWRMRTSGFWTITPIKQCVTLRKCSFKLNGVEMKYIGSKHFHFSWKCWNEKCRHFQIQMFRIPDPQKVLKFQLFIPRWDRIKCWNFNISHGMEILKFDSP